MTSPGHKQGLCGHLMAGFDSHMYCARCIGKSKGDVPGARNEKDCKVCNFLSSEQKAHLATPSYQEKRSKRDQKVIMEESDSTLGEPCSFIVIWDC